LRGLGAKPDTRCRDRGGKEKKQKLDCPGGGTPPIHIDTRTAIDAGRNSLMRLLQEWDYNDGEREA